MQLLAKFKKILDMEFRATLNFRKFKKTNPLIVHNDESIFSANYSKRVKIRFYSVFKRS